MKKLFTVGIAIASATLISPLVFSEASAGCYDEDYHYSTGNDTEYQQERADFAKGKFCRVVTKAHQNYGNY